MPVWGGALLTLQLLPCAIESLTTAAMALPLVTSMISDSLSFALLRFLSDIVHNRGLCNARVGQLDIETLIPGGTLPRDVWRFCGVHAALQDNCGGAQNVAETSCGQQQRPRRRRQLLGREAMHRRASRGDPEATQERQAWHLRV